MSLIDFVNDRAVLLRTTVPRNINPRAGKYPFLQAVPPVFHVSASGAASPDHITLTATFFGIPGVVTWSVDGGALSGSGDNVRTLAFADVTAAVVTVTAQITYQGEVYAATQVIQKFTDGLPGVSYTWVMYADSASGAGMSNSPDGKAYIGFAYNKSTPTEGADPAAYIFSLIKGTDGQPGQRGADGTQYWTWIKYSDNPDGTGMYDLPTGSTLYLGIAVNKLTSVESTTKEDYVWSKFKGDQGVPGNLSYTWVKYADSVAGAGLSDSPAGKDYIGFAYNKTTPVEGTDPADYLFSLIKGADGQPGLRGADGTQYFTWIKYSDNADGAGLYDQPIASTLYLGIAVNKLTSVESTTKEDYVWSKFKGDQGVPGANGTPGAPGAPASRTFIVRAYRWVFGAGAPTAIGSATFNWSTLTYDNPPSGWSSIKPAAPGTGYALYEASVLLSDLSGVATTSGIDWAGAARAEIGYIGLNGEAGLPGSPGSPGAPGDLGPQGNSLMVAYTLINGTTLDGAPDTIVKPAMQRPASGDWGSTRAWTATPSVPAAGQCVFQSVGIYNGSTSTWGLPYRSDIRVGSLSAMSVNTGNLTVDGTLTVYDSGSPVVLIGGT